VTAGHLRSAGKGRLLRLGNLLGRLYAVTETAFHEDKALIEAQQKLIDLDPSRRMLPTSLDAGPTQFRRLVDTLQTAEPGTAATERAAATS